MIDRYSLPKMRSLWTKQRKLENWLEIETLACEGMAELGIVPKEDARIIREKGTFRIREVKEIEKRTNHDVIAFLEEVAVHVGEFGVKGPRTEASEKEFREQIAILKELEVPLAALWKFYVKPTPRPDWLLSPSNDKTYMLEAVEAINRTWVAEQK